MDRPSTNVPSPNGVPALQERLDEPQVAAALNRLLDRIDALERTLSGLAVLADQAPGLLAMVADTVDEGYRQVEAAGIDLDTRMHTALEVAEKLTAPRTMAVLSGLLDRVDRLEQLLLLADQAPGLLAMAVDTADEFVEQAVDAGYDIETGVRQGASAAFRFGMMMGDRELSSIEALIHSGVFDPRAIGVVGTAGEALVRCQEACMQAEGPPRVTLFGLLRAMKEPEVQRMLGFLLNFARFFGEAMGQRHSEFTASKQQTQEGA